MDHEAYPKSLKNMTTESLEWQIKDAAQARDIQPWGINYSYYADEVNYIGDELRNRGDKS